MKTNHFEKVIYLLANIASLFEFAEYKDFILSISGSIIGPSHCAGVNYK